MKSIETEVVALVERNGRLILQSAGMEQEKGYIQHGAVSCYLHSFFVAYMSVWLAKRFRIRVHLRSLVRGALLHDYFLYDWHIKDPNRKAHGFSHAAAALQNAERDCFKCSRTRCHCPTYVSLESDTATVSGKHSGLHC